MNPNSFLRSDKRWIATSLIVLAIGVIWTFSSRVPNADIAGGPPPPSPRQGFTAPDFTLDLLGGGQVTLSDLRGKVVLVNLWATWCPPCRAEMPAIEKVYRSFKSQGLEILAVNMTNQDSEASAAAFIQELGLTFPIPLDRSGDVGARYILRGLPSSYFIDRKGVIRSVVVGGPMNEALIQSKVEELLKETK
jgi:cytochrome c biogenesis protein CcmG/thiol:disulfide interchange protein DsbE